MSRRRDNRKVRSMPKCPDSSLAHRYLDGLQGVEIGASAHNPFNIAGCLNVDYTADTTTPFKQEEVRLCGEMAPVDVVADGAKLPFPNESLDFVLSSHVLEHFYDPIGVLNEWLRVVRPGGYVFAVVPHKERTFDAPRPRTTLAELVERHANPSDAPSDDHRHYSVWVTEDLLELCRHMGLDVVDWQDADDKVGNGFTVVIRKGLNGAGDRE